MSVALVNSASGNGTADPATLAFTCNAGSNLLVVAVQLRTGGGTPAGGPTIATIDYGGTPMTIVAGATNQRQAPAGGWIREYVAYLYAPTTGSSLTISADLNGSTAYAITAMAFSGAEPTFTPVAASANGGSATPQVAIVPTFANGVIVTGCAHEQSNAFTGFGAGQNVAMNGTGPGTWCRFATYELNAGVGSDTQSGTAFGSDIWCIGSVFFAPAGSGVATFIPQIVHM